MLTDVSWLVILGSTVAQLHQMWLSLSSSCTCAYSTCIDFCVHISSRVFLQLLIMIRIAVVSIWVFSFSLFTDEKTRAKRKRPARKGTVSSVNSYFEIWTCYLKVLIRAKTLMQKLNNGSNLFIFIKKLL